MSRNPRPHDAIPLRTVAAITGLSPDLIRAWEKRYGAVRPVRGPRGARLYSTDQVGHLRLLARLVESGRAIGDIAHLDAEGLRDLAGRLEAGSPPVPGQDRAPPEVQSLIDAVLHFDADQLSTRLGDALIALGRRRFVERIVRPLLDEVGLLWGEGRLSIAQEHLVSSQLRILLGAVMRSQPAEPRPTILLATISGERHEFGLLIVAFLALDAGLRVIHLGIDLPADEIRRAASACRAGVVGVGVVSANNHARAVEQVRSLEEGLPPAMDLWLGGADAQAVARDAGAIRTLVLDDLAAVERELARVAARAAAGP